MYLINYWTNCYYEDDIWDKYYCKWYNSARKQIIELMELYWHSKKEINFFKKEMLRLKTVVYPSINIDIKLDNENSLFIQITYYELI